MVGFEGKKACRHCGKLKHVRARGLCYRCYNLPGVIARHSARPHKLFVDKWHGPLPGSATSAPPGSAEKIAVMTARAGRGEQVFHPADVLEWAAESGPGELSGLVDDDETAAP